MIVAMLLVTAAGIGVNYAMQKSAEGKQEALNKKQQRFALATARRNGVRSMMGAMRAAASGSTGLRMDTEVATQRLDWLRTTEGKGKYVVATKAAREAMDKRTEYNYGKPVGS